MSHRSGKGHKAGNRPGARKPDPTKGRAMQAPVPPSEAVVESLIARIDAGEEPVVLADQIVQTMPAPARAALLDALEQDIGVDAFGALLVALLRSPLDDETQEYLVRKLERVQTPPAVEALVDLGEHASAKPVRRAAKGALFRLRQAGVAIPEPERSSIQDDAAGWPVVQAWATRIDCIGSQAVVLARKRPLGDLAFTSIVVSDDRGIVDALGQVGVGPGYRQRLAEGIAGPPGTATYDVGPEYVVWRVGQGEETNRRTGRPVADDFLKWSYLLNGIDTTWQPDLEALCRKLAQPDHLDRTAVLLHSLDFNDWWPDPEGPEGRAVHRFVADIEAALDRLPNYGRLEDPGFPSAPPYLELLSETHYLIALTAFSSAGWARIEEAIDKHFDRLLPTARLSRYRQGLLHMGYLTAENARPVLSSLIMTAAWGLDPASGIPPRRHPFLRQSLRKAADVLLAT